MQTTINVSGLLERLGACNPAQKWASEYPDAREAWEKCERPDWMLWLARRIGIPHKQRVRAACACARTALKYVPEGEDRPRIAIETTERWCDDAAALTEVLKAKRAAYAAAHAYADDAHAAAHAAYAAADAADAADDDAHAAAAADAAAAAYTAAYADDAHAAADAADAADDDAHAAKIKAYREMAVLVRQIISFEDIERAIA